MTELIERLRFGEPGFRLCDEAADEIERLQNENQLLRAKLEEWKTLAWEHANTLRKPELSKGDER